MKSANESIQIWAVKLRSLSVKCESGAQLKDISDDRLIFGLNSGNCINKMLSDCTTSTIFEDTLKSDGFHRGRGEQQYGVSARSSAVAAGPADMFRSGPSRQGSGGWCSICGGGKHPESRCFSRSKEQIQGEKLYLLTHKNSQHFEL
ncbi:hypothetical protein JTB14_038436 [Gonioctena quinquepunctata]|nr:hypothetical protein JTB14_038436 [Gonioctena quinquepunctata]